MNEMFRVINNLNDANSELEEFLNYLNKCVVINNQTFMEQQVRNLKNKINNQKNIVKNSIIPAIERYEEQQNALL